MRFSGIKIGFALTGSYCTILTVLPHIKDLVAEGADILPILSPAVRNTDTRFIKADDLYEKLVEITGKEPISTMVKAEPIGPQKLVDIMVVAPCTGTTLAKLALGLSDTSVTLACKSQLRNSRPVVLAISTNDGLGTSAKNLAALLNKKQVYFVPFGQDAPNIKQNSLIAKMDLIPETLLAARENRQLQPVLIDYHN